METKTVILASPGTQFWPCMKYHGSLCDNEDCKPQEQVTK